MDKTVLIIGAMVLIFVAILVGPAVVNTQSVYYTEGTDALGLIKVKISDVFLTQAVTVTPTNVVPGDEAVVKLLMNIPQCPGGLNPGITGKIEVEISRGSEIVGRVYAQDQCGILYAGDTCTNVRCGVSKQMEVSFTPYAEGTYSVRYRVYTNPANNGGIIILLTESTSFYVSQPTTTCPNSPHFGAWVLTEELTNGEYRSRPYYIVGPAPDCQETVDEWERRTICDSGYVIQGTTLTEKNGRWQCTAPGCEPSWICGEWSTCSDVSKQVRECTDTNSCLAPKYESQNCQYIGSTSVTPATSSSTRGRWCILSGTTTQSVAGYTGVAVKCANNELCLRKEGVSLLGGLTGGVTAAGICYDPSQDACQIACSKSHTPLGVAAGYCSKESCASYNSNIVGKKCLVRESFLGQVNAENCVPCIEGGHVIDPVIGKSSCCSGVASGSVCVGGKAPIEYWMPNATLAASNTITDETKTVKNIVPGIGRGEIPALTSQALMKYGCVYPDDCQAGSSCESFASLIANGDMTSVQKNTFYDTFKPTLLSAVGGGAIGGLAGGAGCFGLAVALGIVTVGSGGVALPATSVAAMSTLLPICGSMLVTGAGAGAVVGGTVGYGSVAYADSIATADASKTGVCVIGSKDKGADVFKDVDDWVKSLLPDNAKQYSGLLILAFIVIVILALIAPRR